MNKEQTIMICPQCGEIDGSCKDNYDWPELQAFRSRSDDRNERDTRQYSHQESL